MPFYSAHKHRLTEDHWTYHGQTAPWTDTPALDHQLTAASQDSRIPETSLANLPPGKSVLLAKHRLSLGLREHPRYVEFSLRTPRGDHLLFWNAAIRFPVHPGSQHKAGRLFVRTADLQGHGHCTFTRTRADLVLQLGQNSFTCEWADGASLADSASGYAQPATAMESEPIHIRGPAPNQQLLGRETRHTFHRASDRLLVLYPQGKWTWNPLNLARRWFKDTHILCDYENSLVQLLREQNPLSTGTLITALCGATLLPNPPSPFGAPP